MRSQAAGFTLIELLTVIAIAAILAAVAIPSFGYLSATTSVKSAATELYLAMIRARSEAVKRSAPVTIAPTGGDWGAGWQIRDAANNVLIEQGKLKGVSVAGGIPDADGKCQAPLATVVFQMSGRVTGPPPCFVIIANKEETIQRCVVADLTGRPYIKTETTTCP